MELTTRLASVELTSSPAPLPTLADLPQPLQRCVFMQLSVKERARACCVCRAWQQAINSDVGLWEALDLGSDPPLALLHGAVARTQGRLRSLTVLNNFDVYTRQLLREGVVPVLQRNPFLRHLRLTAGGSALDHNYVLNWDLEMVARAGTQLETLACGVHCRGAEPALALLTKQAPFGALQLGGLGVDAQDDGSAQLLEVLGANLSQQPSLLYLSLSCLRIPPLLNSTPFFDVLMASRVNTLSLGGCDLGVHFAAGLARLLHAGRLERLKLYDCQGMFTPEATAQLSHALRHSSTLLEFRIYKCQEAAAVLDVILLALESHPTLEALALRRVRCSAAARDVLLRVIAADSSALHALDLWGLREDELSLSAIAGALQQTRHLQDLHLGYGDVDYENDDESLPIPAAYEEHLLPAVLACTSLRKLSIRHGGGAIAHAAAVMKLVADREAARLAAELVKEPGRSA